MMKQGGNMLSGRAIFGLCLVVIGLLTLGYGGVEFGFGLSLGFQSFLIGGLICILPDLEILLQLIADVAVIGFAAFLAVLLLRK